jgi:hypothetical protein
MKNMIGYHFEPFEKLDLFNAFEFCNLPKGKECICKKCYKYKITKSKNKIVIEKFKEV